MNTISIRSKIEKFKRKIKRLKIKSHFKCKIDLTCRSHLNTNSGVVNVAYKTLSSVEY